MGQADPQIAVIESKANKLERLRDPITKLEQTVNDPSRQVAVSVEATDIAKTLVSNQNLLRKLVTEIVEKYNNQISQHISNELSNKREYRDIIVKDLGNDANFINSIASIYQRNLEYQKLFQGSKGEPGNIENTGTDVVRGKLAPLTVWCGDGGTVCNLPPGKNEIAFGSSGHYCVLKRDGSYQGEIGDPSKCDAWISNCGNGGGCKAVQGNTFANPWGFNVGSVVMTGDGVNVANGKAYMNSAGQIVGENLGVSKVTGLIREKGGGIASGNRLVTGKWIIYERGDGMLVFYRDGADRVAINKNGTVWTKDYGWLHDGLSKKGHGHTFRAMRCCPQWSDHWVS